MTDERTSTIAPTAALHERRGRAMGTSYHLLTVGADDTVIERVEQRLHELEARWSRFLPNSEVSQLNAAPDLFHLVSRDTITLIEHAIAAWALTDGAFDPTVLNALTASGYDRDLDECGDDRHLEDVEPTRGCAGIEIDSEICLVRLGADIGFDPGGIGKGLAADILTAEAQQMGATGVLVNLGGDLVCRGQAPGEHGWVVEVSESSVCDGRIAIVGINAGAVVTSTTAKRRWATGDGERHHVIDPSTGEQTTGLVLATVVASDGWYAEAVATHLLVTSETKVVDTHIAAAIVIDAEGATTTVGRMNEYLR